MKSILTTLILLLAMLACVPAHAADDKHLRAVADMLGAVKFDILVGYLWSTTDEKMIGERQAMQQMPEHITRKQIQQRFAPVFARHIDLAGARRIAAAPESADNKRAYQRVETAAKDEASTLIWSWARDYHVQLYTDAIDRAKRVERDITAQALADRLPSLPGAAPMGVDYIDAVVAARLALALRQGNASYKLNRDYADIGVTNLVAPDTLVSPARIGESQRALARMEKALEAFEREAKAGVAAADAQLKAVDFAGAVTGGDKMRQGILAWLPPVAAMIEQVVKNQRAMLDVERRLLDFAVARQGKITAQGGGGWY